MNPSAHGEWAVPDLQRPWFAPYAGAAAAVFDALGKGASASESLNAHAPGIALDAGALRFVAADAAPPGEAYEAFIARTACVPTRDNLHDLFNGVVWMTFPHIKRRLNELQAHEIARAGVGASRGPLRDALTLFDENGALLDAPPALWDALLVRDWQALFITHRALWSQARLRVFGHALLEKLATVPRKPLTAHVLVLPPGASLQPIDDASLAKTFESCWFVTKPFAPLPVMGIPLWCFENQDFSFYDDSQVFRPRRAAEEVKTQAVPRSRSA